MVSTKQDVTIWAGESKRLDVTIRDEASAALNISNCRVQWALTPHLATGTKILHKDNQALTGVILITPLLGVCRVMLDSVDTESLHGSFVHEMKLTDADGFEHTVLVGKFIINRSILP